MSQANTRVSRKEKADLYLALAEAARRKYEHHHGVEWRINFGLWTFFVAGAALVATSAWLATTGACIGGTVLSVFLLYVYACWWLPHSHKYREECTRSAYWWQTYARELFAERDGRLPGHLKPLVNWKTDESTEDESTEDEKRARWREPSDADWNPKQEAFDWGGKWHTSHKMCIAVTVALMLLFLGAVWDKWYRAPTADDAPLAFPAQLVAAGDRSYTPLTVHDGGASSRPGQVAGSLVQLGQSLVWPALILILACVFRDGINSLLRRWSRENDARVR